MWEWEELRFDSAIASAMLFVELGEFPPHLTMLPLRRPMSAAASPRRMLWLGALPFDLEASLRCAEVLAADRRLAVERRERELESLLLRERVVC